MSDQCMFLQRWLHYTVTAPDEAASIPPVELVEHITRCTRCTVALRLYFAGRDERKPIHTAQACDSVVKELATFVDYERANGLTVAARAFPSIWWPVAFCSRCAAAYGALQVLAATLPESWQSATQLSLEHARLQLRIQGGLLKEILRAEQQLGVAWGESYSDVMISEEGYDEYRILIYLRRKQAGRLTLVVRTDPPAKGIASLMIAHAVYYLQLEPDGSAVFADLGEDLFDADNDLLVTVDTLG
jgi:hypothetical protein